VCTENCFGEAALRRLDASIHASRSTLAPFDGVVAAYDRLLQVVRSRSVILARRTAHRRRPDVERALAAMALHHADWLRSPEDWQPPATASEWPVLASLAEQLFARFALPRFLASAWRAGEEAGEGAVARRPEHEWYKRLGRGESVRRIGLPLPLTRAMAHRFLQAPDHFTMIRALRWAQVLTLGGSDELAVALMPTRLGRCLENEGYWEEVIRFFVQHPELPTEQLGPIVDFVQHQRFATRAGVAPDGSYGWLPPPRPDFTLKGRTPASLLRLVAAWHDVLGTGGEPYLDWPRAPIGELRRIERGPRAESARGPRVENARGPRAESVRVPRAESAQHAESAGGGGASPAEEVRIWTISELCSSHALLAEGQAMHHCVRTYVTACRNRHSSIWSLQLETRRGRSRLLTIEVRMPARRIVQARRIYNGWPEPTEAALMAQWAAQEKLVIGDEIRRR
jgi:PcfJ-like protein